jgi:hypothetical protein
MSSKCSHSMLLRKVMTFVRCFVLLPCHSFIPWHASLKTFLPWYSISSRQSRSGNCDSARGMSQLPTLNPDNSVSLFVIAYVRTEVFVCEFVPLGAGVCHSPTLKFTFFESLRYMCRCK